MTKEEKSERINRLWLYVQKMEALINAAVELYEAWEPLEGDLAEDYPSYLPSFDEFAHDLMEMRDSTRAKINALIIDLQRKTV